MRLATLAPGARVVEGLDAEGLRKAEVVYLGKGQCDPAAAPRLEWVQFNSAGVAPLLDTALARSGIPVLSASGAYSTPVAEMVVAVLLALLRRLPEFGNLQQRRTWKTLCGDTCRGRTVGIVGYGSIGREAARLLRAFGMRVLACKRRPHERIDRRFHFPGTGDPGGALPEAWFGIDEIDRMLPQADVLLVTLPGTAGTTGLLDRRLLELLPSHARVINVGRGTVFAQTALTELLQEGRLAGAALDVFAEEPLPPDDPLWGLPNVIITPHIASYTSEQPVLAGEVFLENMRRHLIGEPLLNLVDFTAGY